MTNSIHDEVRALLATQDALVAALRLARRALDLWADDVDWAIFSNPRGTFAEHLSELAKIDAALAMARRERVAS